MLTFDPYKGISKTFQITILISYFSGDKVSNGKTEFFYSYDYVIASSQNLSAPLNFYYN
jgi:hypothetical protein